jgi:hypothetical protein
MSARLEKMRSFSPRAIVGALLLSILLHGLLLAAFGFLKGQERELASEPIDTRITEDGPSLFLDLSSESSRKAKQASEEPLPTYPVHLEPASPFTAGNEQGPQVVARTGPAGASGRGTPSEAGSGAGSGRASFFRVPVLCRRPVFVIDRSLSMGPSGGLNAARRELSRCLRALPAEAVFQVVLYNRGVETLSGGMLPVTAQTLREAEELLAQTQAEGGTDHEKAFICALNYRPDAIFLVTDADDLTPEVLKAIARTNHDQVAIHTIDVARRRTPCALLEDLARQNRGTHIRVFAFGNSAWPH